MDTGHPVPSWRNGLLGRGRQLQPSGSSHRGFRHPRRSILGDLEIRVPGQGSAGSVVLAVRADGVVFGV